MATIPCPACARTVRLRRDGRIAQHRVRRSSDSGWSWADDPVPTQCPASRQPPKPPPGRPEASR